MEAFRIDSSFEIDEQSWSQEIRRSDPDEESNPGSKFCSKVIDLSDLEPGLLLAYSSQNLNFESYASGEKMQEELKDFEKKVEAAI